MRLLSRPGPLEKYCLGQELTEDDRTEILRRAGDDVLKTFVFEDLSPAQQMFVAKKCSDYIIDYFLDRDDICNSAQGVLADRNVAEARRRLSSKPCLSPTLHAEFLKDEDVLIRHNMALREDATQEELARLVCDEEPLVFRAVVERCAIYSNSELGEYLRSSPNSEIRRLAQRCVKEPPDRLEIAFGPLGVGEDLPILSDLPEILKRDLDEGGLGL